MGVVPVSARKPPSKRQGHQTDDVVVELVQPAEVPEPDPDWLPRVAEEWAAFWADDELVSIVRPALRPALVRLFAWRDKMLRSWAEADAFREAIGDDHLVDGSTGQQVANPLYALADKAEQRALSAESKIQALEDRFGLTPGALFKLGVDFQRREGLAAANARVQEALGGSSAGSASADDPRSLPGDTAVDAS